MNNRKLVLLLAVPAVMMMCRASARRSAWLEGADPEGIHHGHGRPFGRSRFGPGPGFGARAWGGDPGAWRLPPFIEAKLGEWHRAAHAEGAEGGASTATEQA